ncbi:hypothetical protein [Lacrimispora sp.]|uniref:hypothetical protein n=1 Tax=Lacrimispora sp. TaxID=2719234 RepID=UPI0028A8FCC0|nr:hypothetical protein [Lacrimispora sp.]
MNAPRTYSDWMNCFDIIRSGSQDSEILECVKKGTLALSGGVAGRFATQMNSVIQYRIKRASDKFDRLMQMNQGDMIFFGNALLGLRKEFIFLIQFAQIPVLPSKEAEALCQALKEQATTMQKSLEATTVKLDRTGMLTSIISKNKIDKLDGI